MENFFSEKYLLQIFSLFVIPNFFSKNPNNDRLDNNLKYFS